MTEDIGLRGRRTVLAPQLGMDVVAIATLIQNNSGPAIRYIGGDPDIETTSPQGRIGPISTSA